MLLAGKKIKIKILRAFHHIWKAKACVAAARLFHGCVVLRCPVCLESSRLSDCQLLSPHFAVQLVPSVSRPAENKILPWTGSWMLKHVSSQVGLVLGYRIACFLSFNDARQCKTFKAHPQVYSMFLFFLQTEKKKACAIKALFWEIDWLTDCLLLPLCRG